MSLTQQDLKQIRGLMVEVFNEGFETLILPRFEAIERDIKELRSRLSSVESTLQDHTRQLRELNQKVSNVDGRLEAVENDVKELYVMVADMKKNKLSARYGKLTPEEKLVAIYNDFQTHMQAIAKEMGVKLPTS